MVHCLSKRRRRPVFQWFPCAKTALNVTGERVSHDGQISPLWLRTFGNVLFFYRVDWIVCVKVFCFVDVRFEVLVGDADLHPR